MIDLPKPVRDVVFCEVEDGAVLLHPTQELYYGLNRVGAEIWHLLPPAESSVEGLVTTLAGRYPDVAASVLRADVEALLADLAASGLVIDGK